MTSRSKAGDHGAEEDLPDCQPGKFEYTDGVYVAAARSFRSRPQPTLKIYNSATARARRRRKTRKTVTGLDRRDRRQQHVHNNSFVAPHASRSLAVSRQRRQAEGNANAHLL
ncbi:unnamed protein product [Cuscuta epithymum]|uniref:Uncharacterized protein n=1 Tax=Cuscuta epithymum TaxID=186058 RepID=A0AAV0CNW5_9ASTE|nr:unnamed protein product [Cuscuta epithymum]